jgi:hypothetical protein
MGENTKLLLESMRVEEVPVGEEPVSYDVKSLLQEIRDRVYTVEGRKLVEAARQEKDTDKK